MQAADELTGVDEFIQTIYDVATDERRWTALHEAITVEFDLQRRRALLVWPRHRLGSRVSRTTS